VARELPVTQATFAPGAVWPDWPLILAYHSVSDQRQDGLSVRPADFEWQMRWLAEHGYRSLTLAEYARQRPRRGEKIVLITFDDGYADNATQAFPILQRYQLRATLFLIADLVDQDHVFWWDQPKVRHASERGLFAPLRWSQVQRLAEAGFEFGSHTCTHPPALTQLEPEACWREIAESRLKLEQRLGTRVVSFCYPRGDLNPAVVRMVEQAGYACAVVTPPRLGIPLNRYTLRRISLYREYTPWHFRFMTTTFFRRNYEQFKRLRRLIRPSAAASAGQPGGAGLTRA
jgi:peptidoglycan/xylan/chitin deacetylase (PgdA/CDA1 family)